MIIAPSILSLDYAKFSKQLNDLNKSCKWLHFDVMDGHFVPNLSFGTDIFKCFRKNSPLFMDVHLMVDNPSFVCESFITAGADSITFHLEAVEFEDDVFKLIEKIKRLYLKCGISIKPDTDVEYLYPYLDKIDLVLIMSVEPGFGGQKFMPMAYDKVSKLNKYRKEHNLNFLIEVDGGINDKNAYSLKECGADVLVAGSYVFNGDICSNIVNISFNE